MMCSGFIVNVWTGENVQKQSEFPHTGSQALNIFSNANEVHAKGGTAELFRNIRPFYETSNVSALFVWSRDSGLIG